MLSRVADSLYWMSRYLERAEHTARLVNVNLNLTLDRDAGRCGAALGPAAGEPADAAAGSPTVTTPGRQPTGATLDLANRDSIAACIGAARENARQVREQISSEMWEQINRLFLAVRRDAPRSGAGPPARTSSWRR